MDAVSPNERGTKVTAHYVLTLKSNESFKIRVKLDNRDNCDDIKEFAFSDQNFDEIFKKRKAETDNFYSEVISRKLF